MLIEILLQAGDGAVIWPVLTVFHNVDAASCPGSVRRKTSKVRHGVGARRL
ncbi:hypothetical protein J2X01_002963 [Arthrobacter ginsengisoli]|uniref:Uncharacterized protein n=1 Tax=Arthrobacter ginsengisoli TaxID=1356565 RepID=A0ABU1UEP5_9MICC|nr:hypothetical protein [Arthrobacter ginsengisoli]MDR7083668.1 hypothetical protein [Arthrobacter ginsengisoli]